MTFQEIHLFAFAAIISKPVHFKPPIILPNDPTSTATASQNSNNFFPLKS